MSYGIMPYLIEFSKIDELRNLVNESEKIEFYKKIDNEFRQLQMNFYDSEGLDEGFLDAFVSGETNYKKLKAEYWYLIEIIARKYGMMLNNSQWCPSNIDNLYTINALKMFDIKGVPCPDDFPSVFMTRVAEYDELKVEVEQKVEDENQKKQFLTWINYGKSLNKDLILFYY